MSNKIIIPLIIVLSLITIGVASLTQLNKSSEKVVVVTSSVTISSVKSQVVSISSTIQTNSSIAVLSAQTSSAQKVEGSKVGSVNSPNLQKCQTVLGVDSILINDKCIGIAYGYDASFIWKNSFIAPLPTKQQEDDYNQDRLYETPQNKKLLKEMAVDFYNKFKSTKKLPTDISIVFADSKKTQNGFEISGGVQGNDTTILNSNLFGFLPISSTYLIFEESPNNWSWKAISFENKL